MNITWRDDDVGQKTQFDTLDAVDKQFQRYGVPHTIAVIASGIDARPDLVELIRERRMIVQLHCWNHDDLSVDDAARGELERAVDLLASLFTRPTVLYPPWNRTGPELEETAARLGLTVSNKKVSVSQYVRAGGDVSEDVVNFHHWHVPDAVYLRSALAIGAKDLDLEDDFQVSVWTETFSCTVADLAQAVEIVGHGGEDVRRRLGFLKS